MVAEAHSWADCVDWRFNDPTKPGWSEKDGKCFGYARQFPAKKNKPFGDLDSDSPSRHYQQGKNMIPCSPGKDMGDGGESGADESRKVPLSKSYEEGNKNFGPMSKVKAGDQMCVRWPSKNHAFESKIELVHINMPLTPLDKDPTQAGFEDANLVKLKYNNCSFTDDKDHTPCGGCFKIPETLATGDYVLQWRWLLVNSGAEEYYTSCWDVNVQAAGPVDPTAPIPLGANTNVFGSLIFS
ncbi:hypothetical protein BGX34_010758 [Mortierella sp. NVP85]|nr:hypothetical protein BGX34_010758 [Mortierella sp. NVP85]